jgi:SAM-dependent methyltransferase
MTEFRPLVQKWDSMFLTTVDPTRLRRMEAILGALGGRLQAPFRVFDLGTGPGPLADRLLQRFKGSRLVGVDSDPVLLRVSELAMSRYGKRVTWVLADLRSDEWASESFDAAVSSLTLHWLEEAEIRRLYRALGRLLRPGGIVVNGDFVPSQRTRASNRGSGRPGPTTAKWGRKARGCTRSGKHGRCGGRPWSKNPTFTLRSETDGGGCRGRFLPKGPLDLDSPYRSSRTSVGRESRAFERPRSSGESTIFACWSGSGSGPPTAGRFAVGEEAANWVDGHGGVLTPRG